MNRMAGKKRPGPGCAVWETTLRCNLKCMHCGSAAGRARSDELSTEEALGLCNQLAEIGTLGVAMMGGEPLVRADWPEVASRIRELGMELSIITNGFIHDPVTFQQISAIQPELVTVSLDGGSAETHDMIRGVPGSYERALNSIDTFVELGLPTGVITTVHKLNLKELKTIRRLLLGKGVSWQIQMATPFGRLTREHVLSTDEFYAVAMFIASTANQYSKKQIMVAGAHDMGYFSDVLPTLQVRPWQGCQAGISTLGIQSNGNVMGCLSLSADEFIEGNVRDTRLSDIWNSDSFAVYTRRVASTDLGDACAHCDYARTCKGGCSSVSYSLCGGLHRDAYCLYALERKMRSKRTRQ